MRYKFLILFFCIPLSGCFKDETLSDAPLFVVESGIGGPIDKVLDKDPHLQKQPEIDWCKRATGCEYYQWQQDSPVFGTEYKQVVVTNGKVTTIFRHWKFPVDKISLAPNIVGDLAKTSGPKPNFIVGLAPYPKFQQVGYWKFKNGLAKVVGFAEGMNTDGTVKPFRLSKVVSYWIGLCPPATGCEIAVDQQKHENQL
jgi:hypothetical protein